MVTIKDARAYAVVLNEMGLATASNAMHDLADQVQRFEALTKELREAIAAIDAALKANK